MLTVMVIDDRQRVKFHMVLLQPLDGRHHFFKSGFTTFGNPVAIMEMLRTIDGDTHQKTVFSEKPGPLVINQQTISLNTVLDRFAAAVTLLVLNNGLEKIKATGGWLTTLPGKTDLWQSGLGLHLLPDILAQRCVIHSHGHLFAVDSLLFQIEAIIAGHIALKAAGLGHDMEDGVSQNNL